MKPSTRYMDRLALKRIHGLLYKALVFKLNLAIVPVFLTITFPPLHYSNIVGLWNALNGFLEGPASIFLLLNSIIVAIIASTRMDRGKGQLVEPQYEMIKEEARGEDEGALAISRRQSSGCGDLENGKHDLDVKKLPCDGDLQREREDSAQLKLENNTKSGNNEEAEVYEELQQANLGGEIKASRRRRRLKKIKAGEKPPPSTKQQRQIKCAPLSAATKQSQIRGGGSLEEVWSAIHRDDDDDDEPVQSEQKESPNSTAALERVPSMSLEELNQRAEQFIARFNQQMRLQRQESMQRRHMLILDDRAGAVLVK